MQSRYARESYPRFDCTTDVGIPICDDVGTEKCFVGGTAKSPIYECVKTSNDLEHCEWTLPYVIMSSTLIISYV